MTRELSIYLDLVRFVAALTVFFAHVSFQRYTGGFLWQFRVYAQPAVDVFFVLSGFVIAYVTDKRETTLGSYAINRLSRIYSVVIPALIVTFVLDQIGRHSNPSFYAVTDTSSDSLIRQYGESLVFINQLWFQDIRPGSGISYWSLGYEVWYYIIFGLVVLLPGKRGWTAGIAAACIAGPPIVSLLPLWLAGVACYRLCSRCTLGPTSGVFLLAVSLVAFATCPMWYPAEAGRKTLLGLRPQLLQDYVVGAAFSANVLGIRVISSTLRPLLEPAGAAIRWAAGATFTLYLLHAPISRFLGSQLTWPPASWSSRLVVVLGTIAIVFLIASVTERRKEAWRRWIRNGIRLRIPRHSQP